MTIANWGGAMRKGGRAETMSPDKVPKGQGKEAQGKPRRLEAPTRVDHPAFPTVTGVNLGAPRKTYRPNRLATGFMPASRLGVSDSCVLVGRSH